MRVRFPSPYCPFPGKRSQAHSIFSSSSVEKVFIRVEGSFGGRSHTGYDIIGADVNLTATLESPLEPLVAWMPDRLRTTTSRATTALTPWPVRPLCEPDEPLTDRAP